MPGTVLVVDDHVDTLIICQIILSRNGYEVVTASEGPTALTLAREKLPDAIILDVALPGMDGWTIAGKLLDDPLTAKIPVILFTAHTLESDRRRARDLGCVGYLVKPASPQLIVREVELALQCARDLAAKETREDGEGLETPALPEAS